MSIVKLGARSLKAFDIPIISEISEDSTITPDSGKIAVLESG
jgi:hypothetical protein